MEFNLEQALHEIGNAYVAHVNGRAYLHNLYNVLKSYDQGNGKLFDGLGFWQLTYNVLQKGENDV